MNKESSTENSRDNTHSSTKHSKSPLGESSFVSIKSELTKFSSSLKRGRPTKSPNNSRPTSPPQSSSNSRQNNKSNRNNGKNHNQQSKLNNNNIGSLAAAILSSKTNNNVDIQPNMSRHKSLKKNKIVSPIRCSPPTLSALASSNSEDDPDDDDDNDDENTTSEDSSESDSDDGFSKKTNNRIMSPKKVLSPVRGVNGGVHSRIPSTSTLNSGSDDDDNSSATSSSSSSESDSDDDKSYGESDDDVDSNSDTAGTYLPTRPPNLLRNKKSTTDLTPISTNAASSHKSNVKSAPTSAIQSPIQQQSPGLVTSPTSFTAAGVSLSRELPQKKLHEINRNKGNHINSKLHSQDDRDKKLRSKSERNDRHREYLVDKINPSSREIQQGQSSSNIRPSRNREREHEPTVKRVQKSRERTSDEYRDNQRNGRHKERGAHRDRDYIERGRQMTYDYDGKERAKSKTRGERERERERERGRDREKERERDFGDGRKYRNNNEPHYDMDSNNGHYGQSLHNKSSRKTRDKNYDSSISRAKSLTREPSGNDDLQRRRSRKTRANNTPMERTRSKSLTREHEGRSTDLSKDSLRDKEYEKLIMEKDRAQGQPIRNGGENEDRGRNINNKIMDNGKRAKSKTRDDDKERAKIELEKDPNLLINQIGNKQKNEEPPNIEKDEQKNSSGKGNTAQIFIEETQQHKSITLTPEMTALDVMTIFRSDNTISDAGAWTIFEVIYEYDLERPLRDWESVAWVIGTWELGRRNSLVLRKYAHRNALTLAGFNERAPVIYGWLSLEVKKNKWQKRFVHIKDGSLYHSKDHKGTNETFLCSMVSFDVYICTGNLNAFPTKFVFAIKSQDKITMFENPEKDYMHFLCADHLEKMNEWIIAIRMTKNKIMREISPELFIDIPVKIEKSNTPINLSMPLTNALPAAVSETTSLMNEITFELASFNTTNQDKTTTTSKSDTLRQHVRSSSAGSLLSSFDNSISPPAENMNKTSSFEDSKKKELRKMKSLNQFKTTTTSIDGVFRGGSLLDYDDKNPPVKPVEPEQVKFAKGSLLSNGTIFEQAKEREKIKRAMGGVGIVRDSNNGPLLSIEGDVKFHKGSLLDRNIEGSGGGKVLQRNKPLKQNQQQSRQNNFQPLLRFGSDQKVGGNELDGMKSPPIKPHDGQRDGYF